MAAKTLDDLSADVREGNKIAREGLKQSATEKAKEAENRKEDILRQKELVDTLKGLDLKANLTLDGDKPKGSFLGSLISALGLGTAALGTLAFGALSGYLKQYKAMFLDPIFGVGTKKPSIFFRIFSKIKGFFTRGFAGMSKFLDDMTDSLKIKFRNTRLFKLFTRIKGFFGSKFKGVTDLLDDIGKSIGKVTKGGFIAAKVGLMAALTKIRNFFKLEGAFKGLGQGIDDLSEFFTGKKFNQTAIGKLGSSIVKPLSGIFTGLFGIKTALDGKVPAEAGAKGAKPSTFGKLFSGVFKIGEFLGKIFIPLSFVFGAFSGVDKALEEFERLKKEGMGTPSALGAATFKMLTTLLDHTILALPNLALDGARWAIGELGTFITGDPTTKTQLMKKFGERSFGDMIYEDFFLPIFEKLLPKIFRDAFFEREETIKNLTSKGTKQGVAETASDLALGVNVLRNAFAEAVQFIDPTDVKTLRQIPGFSALANTDFYRRNFEFGLFGTAARGIATAEASPSFQQNNNSFGGDSLTVMVKEAAGGDLAPARYGFFNPSQ